MLSLGCVAETAWFVTQTQMRMVKMQVIVVKKYHILSEGSEAYRKFDAREDGILKVLRDLVQVLVGDDQVEPVFSRLG